MKTDALLLEDDVRVVEALRFVGVRVTSVYDLVNTRESYAAAIPTLTRMLSEVRNPRIKEGIARALSVKEARPAVGDLISEFKRMVPGSYEEESAKWAIGNAIAVLRLILMCRV